MTDDLQLTCTDCGRKFSYSREDQAFFTERGYSEPKRCKDCRLSKKIKTEQGGGVYRPSEFQETAVTCARCGKQTTVPFEPRGDRPVYCRDCYDARKGVSRKSGR